LWDEIEVYIPPAEKSDHPLLIATILMAMVLEQRRLLIGLQTRLDKLEQEAGTEHQKGQAGMRQLQSELRSLDEDVDTRLQKLRLEIKELLYRRMESHNFSGWLFSIDEMNRMGWCCGSSAGTARDGG